MKLFILHTGEYEQRGIHSVHSTRENAVAVWERVTKDWHSSYKDDQADIEEHELDPSLCLKCGYDEGLHKKITGPTKHDFVSDGGNAVGVKIIGAKLFNRKTTGDSNG